MPVKSVLVGISVWMSSPRCRNIWGGNYCVAGAGVNLATAKTGGWQGKGKRKSCATGLWQGGCGLTKFKQGVRKEVGGWMRAHVIQYNQTHIADGGDTKRERELVPTRTIHGSHSAKD